MILAEWPRSRPLSPVNTVFLSWGSKKLNSPVKLWFQVTVTLNELRPLDSTGPLVRQSVNNCGWLSCIHVSIHAVFSTHSTKDWWNWGNCLSPYTAMPCLVQLFTTSYSCLKWQGQTSLRAMDTLSSYKAKILAKVPSPPTYVVRLCSPHASYWLDEGQTFFDRQDYSPIFP